jgi:hypothetical protein
MRLLASRSASPRCRFATEAGASPGHLETLAARPERASRARLRRRSQPRECESALIQQALLLIGAIVDGWLDPRRPWPGAEPEVEDAPIA